MRFRTLLPALGFLALADEKREESTMVIGTYVDRNLIAAFQGRTARRIGRIAMRPYKFQLLQIPATAASTVAFFRHEAFDFDTLLH